MPPGVGILRTRRPTACTAACCPGFSPRRCRAEKKARVLRHPSTYVGAAGSNNSRLGAQSTCHDRLLPASEQDQEAIRDDVYSHLRTSRRGDGRVGRVHRRDFAEYIDGRASTLRRHHNDLLMQRRGRDARSPPHRRSSSLRKRVAAGNETPHAVAGRTVLPTHGPSAASVEAGANPRASRSAAVRTPRPKSALRRPDVEVQGHTVPAERPHLLVGSATAHRAIPTATRSTSTARTGRRKVGYGRNSPRAALARLEGGSARQVLQRFPEWEVDTEHAKLAPTSTVRGWETLPVFTPGGT